MGQFWGYVWQKHQTKDGDSLYGWDIQEEVSKLLKPKMGLQNNESFGVNNFDGLVQVSKV